MLLTKTDVEAEATLIAQTEEERDGGGGKNIRKDLQDVVTSMDVRDCGGELEPYRAHTGRPANRNGGVFDGRSTVWSGAQFAFESQSSLHMDRGAPVSSSMC